MNTQKLLRLLPRVLAILITAFLAIFALDIFDMELGFWGTLLGLFMHLIPNFILIAVIIVAWRRDRLGAILFAALALLSLIFIRSIFGVCLAGYLLVVSALHYAQYRRIPTAPKPPTP